MKTYKILLPKINIKLREKLSTVLGLKENSLYTPPMIRMFERKAISYDNITDLSKEVLTIKDTEIQINLHFCVNNCLYIDKYGIFLGGGYINKAP